MSVTTSRTSNPHPTLKSRQPPQHTVAPQHAPSASRASTNNIAGSLLPCCCCCCYCCEAPTCNLASASHYSRAFPSTHILPVCQSATSASSGNFSLPPVAPLDTTVPPSDLQAILPCAFGNTEKTFNHIASRSEFICRKHCCCKRRWLKLTVKPTCASLLCRSFFFLATRAILS